MSDDLCERGIHAVRWLEDPEYDETTGRWWVLIGCRVCGYQERVDVTDTTPIAFLRAQLALKDLFGQVVQRLGIDRLAAWLVRKTRR